MEMSQSSIVQRPPCTSVVAHKCHAQMLYEVKEFAEAAVVVQRILDTLALPSTQWPSKYLGSKVL